MPNSVTSLTGQIEVVLHERFNRVQTIATLITVEFRQTHLLVPIQHILSPPGVKVELIAQAQQKLTRLSHHLFIVHRERSGSAESVKFGMSIASEPDPTDKEPRTR